MNYFEAKAKFRKQCTMIKGGVICFVEDAYGRRQLEELGAFFDSATNIKQIIIIKDSKLCMLVSPKQYYKALVVGSKYAITHELNDIKMALPNEETAIINGSAVVENEQASQFLNKKTLNKIETFDENTPF